MLTYPGWDVLLLWLEMLGWEECWAGPAEHFLCPGGKGWDGRAGARDPGTASMGNEAWFPSLPRELHSRQAVAKSSKGGESRLLGH